MSMGYMTWQIGTKSTRPDQTFAAPAKLTLAHRVQGGLNKLITSAAIPSPFTNQVYQIRL